MNILINPKPFSHFDESAPLVCALRDLPSFAQARGSRTQDVLHRNAATVYRRLYGADLPHNTTWLRLNRFAIIHSTPVGMWRALANGYVYTPPLQGTKDPALIAALLAHNDNHRVRWRGMHR